ncbi:MAG: peroxiredoxin family protein [Candidatus Poseidoniales archaeon]|nr:peroxiredoxin family protein [Candidatus Poseidoniales archaeon]
MRKVSTRFFAGLLALILLFPGCLGNSSDDGDALSFPQFTSIGDDNMSYSLSDFSGSPFIVLFSAEWCDTPCHMTMHAINSALDEPSMLVMSTDPQENPQGITLQDWHEKASAHDDEEGDVGQTLGFPFMKGVEASVQLEIDARPTIFFVNSDGNIVSTHEGGITDEDEIRSYWTVAGGTI